MPIPVAKNSMSDNRSSAGAFRRFMNTATGAPESKARPMTCRPPCEPLVIAVTPRALFDLRKAAGPDGKPAPGRALAADDRTPLRPGSVFTLVRKLLALNTGVPQQVEVVLVSDDGADAGLRVLHSLDHHGMPVTRAAFARGAPCHR